MRDNMGYALKARLVLCCIAFMMWSGCKGGSTVQATGSADQATDAVKQILEAWKSGETLSQFAATRPEFVVADEDWQGGSALANYKLSEPATLNGSHWRQKTELQLKAKGKSKAVTAIYAVTLDKKTVILRSDFQH